VNKQNKIQYRAFVYSITEIPYEDRYKTVRGSCIEGDEHST
jgi:hypothetical protein